MVYRSKFVLAVMLFLFMGVYSVAASPYPETVKVTFSGGQRTVNLVRADLNDKTIRVEAAVAKNQIGQADDLRNIAEQLATPDREVVAAINGTYFSAYDGYPVPWNVVQKQGEVVHIGNMGSVIGFSADNRVVVENLFVSIEGATNGDWKWPNDWYAWGFNHRRDEPESVVIFTPAYGKTTGPHNKTSVVVDKGVVVDVHTGEAVIPAEGYTVVVGDRNILDRFKVGNKVEYRCQFNKINFNTNKPGEAVNWDNIRTTIGAGPTLIKNGVIIANGAAEGFWEDKILTNRGFRSFVGATWDNNLIIGTVPNVTVRELAEIAQKLNLVNAITLDSNASSGLYYQGKYITRPGRQLSNALVITKLKTPPVRLMVNGQEIFFDADPVVRDGRTLVPMRKIFEEMKIIPAYNPQDMTITAKKDDIALELKLNSDIAKVNGAEQKLEVPAVIINNRTYVPVRFITEIFKGQVEWRSGQNMVVLNL